MPTAQRDIATTAFRTNATAYSVGPTQPTPEIPRRGPDTRPPAPPVPAVRSRQRIQTTWLVMMTLAAMITVVIGLAYLSGYAQVTHEGYRRARLREALRRERDLAEQWEQKRTLNNTSALIEHRARALGMVRAIDEQTVTVR